MWRVKIMAGKNMADCQKICMPYPDPMSELQKLTGFIIALSQVEMNIR